MDTWRQPHLLTLCAGQLALAEARYVIVRMAQEFESLAPAEEVCWVEKATMTLCVKSGCKVILAKAKETKAPDGPNRPSGGLNRPN